MRSSRDLNSCCMTCDLFKLRGQPRADEGIGWCTIYEQAVHWDWNSVLYTPAATMEARLRWLDKFTNKQAAQPQEGNQHGSDTE